MRWIAWPWGHENVKCVEVVLSFQPLGGVSDLAGVWPFGSSVCRWRKAAPELSHTSALGASGVMSLTTQETTLVFNVPLKLWTAFEKSVILHCWILVVLSGKVEAQVRMALMFPHVDTFISLPFWSFYRIPSTGSSWPFKDLVLKLPFLLKKSSCGFEQWDRSGSQDSLDH